MTAPAKSVAVATTAAPAKLPTKYVPPILLRDAARERLTPFLPDGVSYQRVIAAIQMLAQKDPKVTDCTPASVLRAVGRALQSGLDIGTTAHLVPFGTELTFIADYKGLAQLAIASGAVRHIELRCVYAADTFEVHYGIDSRLSHSPAMAKERGAIIGAYCIFRLPFQYVSFEWMPIQDIELIRQKYSKQWKSGDCPPWYAKKTVLRQAVKLLPADPRLRRLFQAIEADEQEEQEEPGGSRDLEIAAAVAAHDDEDAPPAPARDLDTLLEDDPYPEAQNAVRAGR